MFESPPDSKQKSNLKKNKTQTSNENQQYLQNSVRIYYFER